MGCFGGFGLVGGYGYVMVCFGGYSKLFGVGRKFFRHL